MILSLFFPHCILSNNLPIKMWSPNSIHPEKDALFCPCSQIAILLNVIYILVYTSDSMLVNVSLFHPYCAHKIELLILKG